MRLLPLLLSAGLLQAQAPATTAPATSAPPAQTGPLTLDQVLQKFFDAQGGLARLKAIQSRRMQGHIEGLSQPITFDQLNARPDRIRLVTTLEALPAAPGTAGVPASTQIKTYDGKTGWAWSTTETPRKLAPEEIQVLDADFDGPLVDAEAKGNRIEFLGEQTFQNQQALVLKVTLKDKRVQTLYLDPKTFLKFAQVNGEGKAGTELDFWDYQEVQGTAVAFTVIIGPVSVRLDKVELNPAVTDADFQPPKK